MAKNIHETLKEIEIKLAVIETLVKDSHDKQIEIKKDVEKNASDVNELKSFNNKLVGASFVIFPIFGVIGALVHNIIKQFMGWM